MRKLIVIYLFLSFFAMKTSAQNEFNDDALVKQIPGFSNGHANVNGIKLHYVVGGSGSPLILLPGWPQTWWSYHKMMPLLAKKFKVIAIDIRGMGSSDKPETGYDKKTMANDIYQLIHQLGYKQVFVCGHDIGSMVAFSFAANYPDATLKLVMLDIPHPDESWLKIPIIPAVGKITDKIDEDHAFQWWFAFHQLKQLPEELLLGRVHLEHDWIFHYLLYNESAVTAFDKSVYVHAYDGRDGIRAGNAWYQAFGQDIEDDKNYRAVQMPALGIGGPAFKRLHAYLSTKAANLTMVKAKGSGHFIPEEKPKETSAQIINFLQ